MNRIEITDDQISRLRPLEFVTGVRLTACADLDTVVVAVKAAYYAGRAVKAAVIGDFSGATPARAVLAGPHLLRQLSVADLINRRADVFDDQPLA
jgi:hypothetical protein